MCGIYFLDFDWAGPIGIAKYLTPINPESAEGVSRPKEVVLGALLDQKHDLDSLDAALGRVDFSKLSICFMQSVHQLEDKVYKQCKIIRHKLYDVVYVLL